MPISHEQKDYFSIRKSLTGKQEEFFAQWVEFSSVLVKHWSSRFSPAEFQAITFIAGRTLLFRKKAEAITRSQFMNGVRSETGEAVCSGCGLGETTLRKALKTLEDRGFIVVHAFLDGKAELVPRIYEIMPDKLIESFDISEVTSMLRRSKRTTTRPETDDFELENDPPQNLTHPPQILRTPPQNLRDITGLLHNPKTSTNVDVSAASQPTDSGPILRRSRKKQSKGIAINCSEPKVEMPPSAKAKLASLQAKQREQAKARATRAGKLPAKRWPTRDLQALLDEARSACGLTIPRIVVTTKPINTLHRRMVAAGVEDCLDFFTWALRNWNTVANANRKAKARKMRDEKKSDTEMALSPNFNDLAYRFPYILAFYNDRKYMEIVEQQAKEAEREERSRTVTGQRNAMAEHKALVAEKDRQREEARRALDKGQEDRRRSRRSAPSLDDDEIPTFRERTWRQ